MKKTLIVLAAAFAVISTPTASSARPAASQHCVVHVTGQEASGELTVGEPRCYSTFLEAMTSEGVSAWGTGASERVAAGLTFTIGTHFDGAGFTGASTSVVGSDCNGGFLNVSAAWDNRISSTQNGCLHIRHYAGTNLTGSFQTTTAPGGNLTSLNNLTSSIQYLS